MAATQRRACGRSVSRSKHVFWEQQHSVHSRVEDVVILKVTTKNLMVYDSTNAKVRFCGVEQKNNDKTFTSTKVHYKLRTNVAHTFKSSIYESPIKKCRN